MSASWANRNRRNRALDVVGQHAEFQRANYGTAAKLRALTKRGYSADDAFELAKKRSALTDFHKSLADGRIETSKRWWRTHPELARHPGTLKRLAVTSRLTYDALHRDRLGKAMVDATISASNKTRLETALRLAAVKGDAGWIRRLLDAGANPNGASKLGVTALMRAANHGRSEIVRMLLKAGANPNAIDSNGQTALNSDEIFGYPYPEIARMLLKAGANANVADKYGETALMRAADYRQPEIVQMLLKAGANPNAANNYGGYTALIRAAINGRSEIVQMLLKAGANPNVVDSRGRTPSMHAASRGHPEIAQMLENATRKMRAASNGPSKKRGRGGR